MNTKRKIQKLIARTVCIGMTPVLLIGTVIGASGTQAAQASSHREAPLISQDPVADNTDTYAFVSPDRQDTVTLIGSWIPGELPQGGPNFYSFGTDVFYDINVDSDGDAKPNTTYRFTFASTVRNPNTFLYNTGPINNVTDPTFNTSQTYTVTEIANGITTTIASGLWIAPVNIGTKSTPDYEKLWYSTAHRIPAPDGDLKIFAGQTDDPFWVDLGSVFDLLTLRGNPPPIGYEKGRKSPTDGLHKFNVHSIAIQVPIKRALAGAPQGETVIGVWSATSRYSQRVLSPLGGVQQSGDLVQVSRLGMPLVNEVVLPLALKDAFNGLKPEQDFPLFTSGTPAGNLLKQSVLKPELQGLLNGLYGVPVPAQDRNDLLAIFLTGMKTTKPFTIRTKNGKVELPAGFNVNQPKNIVPAEMIRLNTAIKGDLCKPKPDYKLGLLGGDACGFPNGRRLADDVTDIELLAVAGAAYPLLTNDNSFTFNPALIDVLRDNVDENDVDFEDSFPYLALPWQGQKWNAN